MSEDENKNVILRWFDGLNRGNLPLLDHLADAYFRTDFIWHDPRMNEYEHGPVGVKKFIRQLLKEYNNVQIRLHDIFATGDKIAYRFSVSMMEATSGKPVNLQLLAIDRFVDGQIAEEWQLSAPGQW